MDTVTVRFSGGPLDGVARDLPAEPGGGPPKRWVVSQRDETVEPATGIDHLYELAGEPDIDGAWTMRYVRSDPLGMTE